MTLLRSLRIKLIRLGLSTREREVALLVIQGLSNRDISERLHITEQTVKDHLKSVFAKAQVRRRSEFVATVLGLKDFAPPSGPANE